ncbi:MAG: hypothetical protein ACRENK_13810 [Gemmatimonadaceae bacterium]
MRFVVRVRVVAESALDVQLAIDHLGDEPTDIDAVLAVLAVRTYMDDVASSHSGALLTDES